MRYQLLCWLLLPLGLIWVVTAGGAYFLAEHFANATFDRELLNSADSVIARLRSDPVRIWVDMPPAAQAILRHNYRDKIYYQVLRPDGKRISGDAFLPKPIRTFDSPVPSFRYAKLNGEDVRIVRVRAELPGEQEVMVQVAQTLNALHEMTHQIVLSIIVPQVFMIFLGALCVSYGIRRGLIPLAKLEKALTSRSQFDLTPVESSETPIEIKPVVNAINVLLRKLQDDVEQQQRFVANAAHQFRTPLAGLKTYIYAAKRLPCENEPRMTEMLDKLESGIDRLSSLSNKLLTLAKAEPQNGNDNFQAVDLNFIASEMTADFVTEAVPKSMELTFVSSNRPAMIYGELTDLAELTSNLIENAVLYTQEGGNITVRVTNGDAVRLTVQDNGPGIPANEREKVFERFYRILGNTAPGSGLGLPIVKEIASAHNATVEITEPPSGVGTTVVVTFPCAPMSNGKVK